MGWRYEWIAELPADVYDVLVGMLNADVTTDESETHAFNGDI